MATLSPAFQADSERIHDEHQSILEELIVVALLQIPLKDLLLKLAKALV